MSHKIGSKVSCLVLNKSKVYLGELVSNLKLEPQSFEIVASEPLYTDSKDKLYTLLLEDNMVGWTFNKWHVEHWNINEKLLGKKFTQVSDAIINRELPNSEENISAILPKLDTPAPPEPLEISKAEKLKKIKQQLEEDSRIED